VHRNLVSVQARAARSVLPLLAVLGLGCSRSFTLADDASVLSDTGGAVGDGAARFSDSGGPDASAPCASGIEWLDDAPTTRAVDLTSPPALTASDHGFDLVYTYPDSDACSVYCIQYEHVTTGGVRDASVGSARRVGEILTPPRVLAGTTPSGAARLAYLVGPQLSWIEPPSGGAWPEPRGSVQLTGVFGSIAFTDDRVLVQTATAAPRPERPDTLVASSTTAYDAAATEMPVPMLDLALGFDFWSPQLATSAAGPWLAVLQDIDFPPTVQIAGPAGVGWDGTSCGVESFDLATEDASTIVVSEDCGDTVRVVRRFGTAPREQVDLPHRDASSHTRSRIAHAGAWFAVAYRGDDALVHVAVLDAHLTLMATDGAPGSRATTTPTGPLAIAAHVDGTFAVLTSAPYVDGHPVGDAVLQRFRLCR
jgi:hypothetical protein